MDATEVALAIVEGTLDYDGCMAQFYERKHNFANDAELLPDIRQRGVTLFDDAIGFGVLTAIGEENPVVTVLQDVLKNIGSLYIENQQRLEQVASDTHSALANEPDDLPKQIANEATESEGVKLLDYDEESDDIDEVADSGSGYERKGGKRIGKAKRKPGRPKTKGLEEKKVDEAVLVRQKRKRSSHWTTEKLGRDPKRHLYEPLENTSEFSERASSSPSNFAATTRKVRDDDATSPSPSSALVGTITGRYQRASRTSSKQIVNEDVRDGNSANINTPSLVVRLKIRSLVVKLQMPNTQSHHPETPSTSSQAYCTRGARTKRRKKMKSAEFVDANSEDSDNSEDDAQPDSSGPIPKKRRGPASGNAFESTNMVNTSTVQTKAQSKKTVQLQESEPQVEKTSTTKPPPRQRQGHITATSFRNHTPGSFVSKQQNKALRQRRGAISQTSDGSSPPALQDPISTDSTIQAEDEEPNTAPTASSNSGVHAPPSSTDPLASATPAQPLRCTFVPFPPFLEPRALTLFHRGAIIALENVLADHADTPSDSLLDLITELGDTRPIVSDWDHVTVMRGGSWVFQVLRDVWEDREAEKGEQEQGEGGGEEEGEGEEELVDVEDVIGALEGWVGMEMERLGGVVDV